MDSHSIKKEWKHTTLLVIRVEWSLLKCPQGEVSLFKVCVWSCFTTSWYSCWLIKKRSEEVLIWFLKLLHAHRLIWFLLGCPCVNPGCVPTCLCFFVPPKWSFLPADWRHLPSSFTPNNGKEDQRILICPHPLSRCIRVISSDLSPSHSVKNPL